MKKKNAISPRLLCYVTVILAFHHCTGSQQSASRGRVHAFYKIAPCLRPKRGGVVRILSLPYTVHNFRPQTSVHRFPSTDFCLRTTTSVDIWPLTLLIHCSRTRAHEWAKNHPYCDILDPRALLFCAWQTARRALGNPGPSSFVICCWLKQRKRVWLVNLRRGKIWTCLAKVVPPSWEFYVCFLCKSQIVHEIVKMCSFRRFLVLKRLQKSRIILLSSL